MLTRRTAITLLPAGLIAHLNFLDYARADVPTAAAITYNATALHNTLSSLQQWSAAQQPDSTFYFYRAAKLMMEFLDELTTLEAVQELSKYPKSRLLELLKNFGKLNEPGIVDHVLTMKKITDDVLDGERPQNFLDRRNELMITIGARNKRIYDILWNILKAPGPLPPQLYSGSQHEELISLAEDALRKGCQLSAWGKDAYFAAARGYCAFQFVTDLVRQQRTPQRRAQAYVLNIVADSESYLTAKVAEADALPNDQDKQKLKPEWLAMQKMAWGLREILGSGSIDGLK
jgi:hypothetical protein